MSRSRSLAAATGLFIVAVTLLGCSTDDKGSSEPAQRETLVVRQEAPLLTDVELDDQQGKAVGDLLFFEAQVTDDAGNEGVLLGSLATVRLSADAGEEIEERLANLVFRFGDDMLVVQGASEYVPGQTEMAASTPQTRAVIGGTGRFLAASGEVVTERMSDGTYTHTFTLVNAAGS
jgi:hypothetical protein